MWRFLLFSLARGEEDVLRWLLSVGGGQQAFPLMDFVTSESAEIDETVAAVATRLAKPCFKAQGSCFVARKMEELAAELQGSRWPKEQEAAALAEWLLRVDWSDLMTQDAGLGLFKRLSAWETSNENGCGAVESQEDRAFISAVERGLAKVETLPLERNEGKWADFFIRQRRGEGFCALGVSALFLVAADVTAYAAAAAGGEHEMRLRRALLFAQGIARGYVEEESRPRRRIEMLATTWPLWRLLASIGEELRSGGAAMPRHGAFEPGAFVPRPMAPLEAEELYLSVVVQCRNDDYGGGMLLRLNRMLATAALLLQEANVPAEIIVVEWNPPASERPLAEVLQRPEGKVPVRVITVPTVVHMALPHNKAHPIFEHIAENVAFRRARGRFVLKTNIDNILSPDTVLFLARRALREDSVYRATYLEYDTDQPESEGMGPRALLEWLFGQPKLLEDANLQLAELGGLYPEDASVCQAGEGAPYEGQRPFYWAGSGDFVLASRRLLEHVRGYPQISQNWQTDDLLHCRLRAVGARQVVLQPPCATVHQNHRRINRVRSSTRWVVTDGNFKEVCGDPFRTLATETADWGLGDKDFQEVLL